MVAKFSEVFSNPNFSLRQNIQKSLLTTLRKQAENKTIQAVGKDSLNIQWAISA
jgi:hypothetical protein